MPAVALPQPQIQVSPYLYFLTVSKLLSLLIFISIACCEKSEPPIQSYHTQPENKLKRGKIL